MLCVFLNGHDDRPGRMAQRRGVIARTSFFVLYSVFKERRPDGPKPTCRVLWWALAPTLRVEPLVPLLPGGRSHS